MLLTVVRAGEALDLFRRQSEWGVTAAASELGIAKSQAHELLTSLCTTGLVRRSGRGRYRLGWATVSLSNELLDNEFGARRALAVRRLAALTHQIVHLVALDRAEIVVLATCRGADDDLPPPGIVDEPLYATAAGRLLQAFHGCGAELAACAPLGDDPEAPELRDEHLREIAHRGIATDLGEWHRDRRGVAAPVVSPDGSVVAALALTTTAGRWSRHAREYQLLVRREAAALSRDLRQTATPALEATRVA